MSSAYLDRLLRAAMKRRLLDGLALRALMKATHLLGLVLAECIRQYRDAGDAVLDRFAQLQEQTLHAALLREALEILASRWDKIPERQRPPFSRRLASASSGSKRSSPCRQTRPPGPFASPRARSCAGSRRRLRRPSARPWDRSSSPSRRCAATTSRSVTSSTP